MKLATRPGYVCADLHTVDADVAIFLKKTHTNLIRSAHAAKCSTLNKKRKKAKKACRETSLRLLAPGDTVSIFGLKSAAGIKYNGCEAVVDSQPSMIKPGRVALQLARNDPKNPVQMVYESKSFKTDNIRVLYRRQEAAAPWGSSGSGSIGMQHVVQASHFHTKR